MPRLFSVPPVAGLQVIHEFTFDAEILQSRVPWSGTPAEEEPVRIRHVVGDTSTGDLERLLDAPPYCYFRHRDGRLMVQIGAPYEEPVLLVTETPGYAYELRYPRLPTAALSIVDADLVPFTIASLERGRGLVAHSCAFVDCARDQAVVCPAISGSGKSTLTRLLREAGAPVQLLTDDRCVLTLDDEVRAWGSPWPGEMLVACADSATVGLMLIIKHGAEPSERVVSPAEAAHHLMGTVVLPLWSPVLMHRALGWIDHLARALTFVEYSYPKSHASVRHLMAEVLPRFLGA